MGTRGQAGWTPSQAGQGPREDVRLPAPTASYRRRAWVEFQRALDPLAPIKPLPPPRT
jgi:hypothetical protein